jgi:hypothetical protein
MAVEFKSGDSSDLATIDPVSKAIRVTQYNSAGEEIADHVPVTIAVSDVAVVDNDMIASFDASPYSYVSFQLSGTWVGAVRFQASNDNGTFKDVVVQNVGDIVEPYRIESTSNSLIKIPILAKYLRVRVTTYVSGTVEGSAFAYKEDVHTGQISSTGEVTIASGQSLNIGNFPATQALSASTANIGNVKILPTSDIAPNYVKVISTTGLNATLLQSGATNLAILYIVNIAATTRFFKLYNKSSAPIVGTDVPLITIPLANGQSNFTIPSLLGIDFSLGLAFAITLGADDSDTTPFTVASEVLAMISYT